jgi:hypothetical protein
VEYGRHFGEDGGQNMLEVYVIEGAAVTEGEMLGCETLVMVPT